MYAQMGLQTTFLTERLIAYIRAIWPLLNMYRLMILNMTLLTERLIAHTVGKRLLPSMYTLMPLHVILLTECFIANIVGICPLLTTYRFQFIWSTLQNERKYIKNSPLKRNKSETPVHYQDKWTGLSGGWVEESVSMSMCECVFVSK
jgi:hypothetical protein